MTSWLPIGSPCPVRDEVADQRHLLHCTASRHTRLGVKLALAEVGELRQSARLWIAEPPAQWEFDLPRLDVSQSADAGHNHDLRRLLVGVPLVVLAIIAVEQLELTSPFPLTRMLMQQQDVPVLLLSCGLLLVLALRCTPAAWGKGANRFAAWTSTRVNLGWPILGAALVVAWGTRYVAGYTPVSHDEIMATFDAEIIGSGRLMAPIPPEWRALSWTLKPAFRLPVPGDVAWVSTYLPGNAVLRGLLGKVFDAALVNAILVAAALLALFGCVRKLWPEHREAHVVAVVLAAASAQVLFMGMTPFAMTAHLALNLIWLWLFLRNTTSGHVAAIGVGFLATGLHQLIFHPLFAAPFILQMLIDRRWRLATLYGVSYAAIGLFWIVYWQLLLAGYGTGAKSASALGVSFFVDRVTDMLRNNSWSGVETMVQNLLRFTAWQHPLMLILLVPGMVLGWRAGGVLRSLAGGIVLTLVAMFILLPYQDIGWGYRYMHGLIGNAALLAAFGWTSLTTQLAPGERRAAWGVLAATTATAVFFLIPIHAWQMYSYISPYTRANAAIVALKEEAVVIETISIHNGIELIRNDPYLRKRPLTFDIGLLDEKLVWELCSRMSVTVFDGARAERYGITRQDATKHQAYGEIRRIRERLESPECRGRRR